PHFLHPCLRSQQLSACGISLFHDCSIVIGAIMMLHTSNYTVVHGLNQRYDTRSADFSFGISCTANDKELLEMGNDFNILEYADPELDNVTGEDNSKEEHKGEKKELPVKDGDNKPDKPSRMKLIEMNPATTTTAEGDSAVTTPSAETQSSTPQPVVQQAMQQQSQELRSPQPPPALPQKLYDVPTATGHLQRLPPGHLQVQQQRVQMRIGPGGIVPGVREGPARVVSVVPSSPIIQHSGVGVSRMGLAPPPPPPPYPGPPPPYPGPCQQEQPLLLEDLLEQEKREQEKQQQNQPLMSQQAQPTTASASPPLLSDVDFERLRADVLGSTTPTGGSPPQGIPEEICKGVKKYEAELSESQGLLPSPSLVPVSTLRPPYPPRPVPQPQSKMIDWQPSPSPGMEPKLGPSGIIVRQQSAPGLPQGEPTVRPIALFNAPVLPAPSLPPENIMTEQDRQTQQQYEQWLNHQNQILTSQLKYYETEVSKLRKHRKSLNSKQRQLRKSGNELAEADARELQRITTEQSALQKHLDSSRKQSRQHSMLMQEYRQKQQQKQRQQQGGGSGLLIGPPSSQQQSVVIHSPLGPPASSPVHHPSTPQSPMMSPSQSPMMQQHSPLQSPGPLLSHSPGPGSVTSMLQHSPGNNSGMSPHSLQPSPRMGTPHSQNINGDQRKSYKQNGKGKHENHQRNKQEK
ncbi:hypothetical protein L9F63_016948, partial [Diploptera punctata]